MMLSEWKRQRSFDSTIGSISRCHWLVLDPWKKLVMMNVSLRSLESGSNLRRFDVSSDNGYAGIPPGGASREVDFCLTKLADLSREPAAVGAVYRTHLKSPVTFEGIPSGVFVESTERSPSRRTACVLSF